MTCSVCGVGMEGLGNSVFFGLEVVFCACWVLACQDMEWGEGHGSFGGVVHFPKLISFLGSLRCLFVPMNLSAPDSGEEHAREELLVAPYPGRRYLAVDSGRAS